MYVIFSQYVNVNISLKICLRLGEWGQGYPYLHLQPIYKTSMHLVMNGLLCLLARQAQIYFYSSSPWRVIILGNGRLYVLFPNSLLGKDRVGNRDTTCYRVCNILVTRATTASRCIRFFSLETPVITLCWPSRECSHGKSSHCVAVLYYGVDSGSFASH